MTHYKLGGSVTYVPTGHKAKILHILPGNEFMIEFEDKDLVPPQMQVSGQYIHSDDLYVATPINSKETHCPKCNVEWHETIIGRRSFYDCLACNLKKEDA